MAILFCTKFTDLSDNIDNIRINRKALPILIYLVLEAITHRESWVQRHRNGFESRAARVNLKEDMDEETNAEGKER